MEVLQLLSGRPDLFLLLLAAFSLLVGSFLNVVIHRLPQLMKHTWNQECRAYLGLKPLSPEPRRLGLWMPFSHCPHCKNTLKPWHNIPVVSYIVLRGRCAFCHARISARYPLVELLTCVASVYIAQHFGLTLQTVFALLFVWISIALIFIDLDHHLLPDHLTLLLLWIGLFASIFHLFTDPESAIMGAIIGYLIFLGIQTLFHLATGKIGMGQGDYKYLAALGAFLGWQQLPALILLASVTGLIFGLVQMAIRQQFKSVPLPFGPWLAIAGWICLLHGQGVLRLLARLYV